MHLTYLRTVGGSVMFAIPKAILDSLHLKPDQSVGLSVNNGNLIVSPQTKPKYTLEELLAQCDVHALVSDAIKEWDETPPIGDEVI